MNRFITLAGIGIALLLGVTPSAPSMGRGVAVFGWDDTDPRWLREDCPITNGNGRAWTPFPAPWVHRQGWRC